MASKQWDVPVDRLTAGNGVEGGGGLFVVGVDGSHPRRIRRIADEVQSPAWSPDGRLLAVLGLNGCGGSCVRTGIYIVRRNGSGSRRVLEGGGSLAWSPDGRSLVFAAGPVVELDLRTGRTREMVRGDAHHTSPDWQPRCTRSGTGRADRVAGGAGPDLLCGLGGHDRLIGGGGRDRLFGGGGDDRIEARDGDFDVVGCGSGSDNVLSDRRDLVGEDCERINR